MTEAIVLSNALGTTSRLWDGQLPALAPRFRVLRYEHRARPSVELLARDVLELLDAEGIERAHFCGISLGGAVGMWLGANAAERVDHLVLACTAAQFPDPERYRERAVLVRDEGTEPVVDATLDRWFTPSFPDRALFRAMLRAAPREAYASCCEAVASWDFRDRLGEIAAPTLVVAGSDDPTVPPDDAERLAAAIPGARLAVLEGARHLANVEQAARFNELVIAHFQEVSTHSQEVSTHSQGEEEP
ncbi:MAG TPA: alpha/beta fold hydrolase [Gaiellaceae bacterium]|nr:alpha/beta fold hydrolase [Gaiellaceae bacterium]